MKNLFCDDSDLRNEEDVVQNFARRFIETLGYSGCRYTAQDIP